MRRKPNLISQFMTSQTGKQIFTICTMPDISRSKINQVIKFGQLIEYNVKNTFFKSCSKWGMKTTSKHFFVFLKKFYVTLKQVVSSLAFHTVDSEIRSFFIFYKKVSD